MKTVGHKEMKRTRWMGSRQGMALGLVMIIVLAVSILGVALISASSMNAVETSRYLNSVKAFWLAEAGVQRFGNRAEFENYTGFTNAAIYGGGFQVAVFSNANPVYAESVGTVQGVEQKIRVKFRYAAPFYKTALYAANASGIPWTFTLRGTGVPNSSDVGGKDVVMGDIFVNGNVKLYEQSIISNAIAPNTYQVLGDVRATGTITNDPAASIRGGRYPNSPTNVLPNLTNMNYAVNNTWNIAQEYLDHGADSSGRLPANHPLRNVVVKNPSNRAAENNSTSGDDYYFEPQSQYYDNTGGSKGASTPLNLGVNQIYYVDGHVWFNNHSVYGFATEGTATIVAKRDVHISDNLKYATTDSLLALVALGQYDSTGQLSTGGNVFFGDPEYGTMYTADAFMLAANNFYYNTSANNTSLQQEPDTGFQVYGNYVAMNQVLVFRDWYTGSVITTNGSGRRQTIVTNPSPFSAWFDPSTNRWRDVVNSNVLTAAQTNTIRHYQMIVKYDERIRSQATQPPGLPGLQSGTGGMFGGIYDWSLYPY
jgi:hypothetical protein